MKNLGERKKREEHGKRCAAYERRFKMMKSKPFKYLKVLGVLVFVSIAWSTWGDDLNINAQIDASKADIGIVFSEILYDSAYSGETKGEWIELYNSTASRVNVGDWTIRDNYDTYKIPTCTIIASKGYLVITSDRAYFNGKYGFNPHLSNLNLELSNVDDYLTLKDKQGNVRDRVAWESGGTHVSGWGSSSQPQADEGKSIVRSNLNQDTDTYTDWANNQTPSPSSDPLPIGTPKIKLSPTELNFEAVCGGSADSQTFTITNSECGSLNWQVTENSTWIGCNPGSGTGSGTVTVTVDPDGLDAGTYTDTITVSDPNASNSPQTVSVTLTVSGDFDPVIKINLTQLSFELECGGETDSAICSISNGGGGTLEWTVTENIDWITCSPESGTNSGDVEVTVNTRYLSAGTYTGTITVSAPNAANSPRTISVTLAVYGDCPPEIWLNRTQLYFGAAGGIVTCGEQTFLIENTGAGTLNWTAASDVNWIACSPTSGEGSGMVTVSMTPFSTGLVVGTYTGTISVSDSNAFNSPQSVSVTLTVHAVDSPPFGTFSTPVNNSIVRSSIPVTGWVLDDVGVESVKIYRHTNSGSGLAYVGDAVFVEGARPDIEQAFPQYPLNYKAGWGYMLLTYFLSGEGDGTYVLEAIAADCAGYTITLGTKTITVDNANAVKPFGAIDTPAQGGAASGSNYRNHGWVLTPQPNKIPEDGATINVYIDGVYLGHPVYNIFRTDIFERFPGYTNSMGAGAYFDFDTTDYANGVHTIYWTATDSAGNADGIGSRYFSILNTGINRKHGGNPVPLPGDFNDIPVNPYEPVGIKKGYERTVETTALEPFYPDDNGSIIIDINELERVEIHFFDSTLNISSLPIGASLDTRNGVFYWQPGPGFVGEYEFLFLIGERKARIKVRIWPKF
jgi:hypothetical protein